MQNFDLLMHGFSIAISVPHIALMIGGVLLGILVGVLPGLGAPNGVSLLLPITFGMQPVSAIIAVVAAVGLYLVFEWSFQVSLPHGLLGAWLDL